jgi:hypothetical protein
LLALLSKLQGSSCLTHVGREGIANVASWTKERLSYWQSIDREANDEAPFELVGNTDALTSDQIRLCVGPSLADQIALAWLSTLLRVVGADPERMSVVQFHKNERGTEILSLGC